MKNHFFTCSILVACTTLLLMLSGTSCTDPETTDSTKFNLFYSGVTDIGPSMNFNLDVPSYIGGTPSDFAITKVTLNDETYQTSSFIINPEKGSITLSDTEKLAVGLYRLTIACTSNGKHYEFKDAVTINMLPRVPEGIKVDPKEVIVNFGDIENPKAFAQVTTETDKHVTISNYAIIQEEGKEYFAITQTGKITVNKLYKGEIPPAKYSLNLKLTTGAGTGIYENAMTFNIISKPLSLTYTPNSVKVEQNSSFTSTLPALKGSTDDLVYTIKDLSPKEASEHVSIDSKTGIISIKADNKLEIGTICKATVTATNKYGHTDFEEALTMNIVAFIRPITIFTYENHEVIQSTAFEISPNQIDGDELSYEFINLPASLNGKIELEKHTGKIIASKGNDIATGNYTLTVKATNVKGEKKATFTLSIKENPNYFTFIHYGNNLGLDDNKEASQYRVNTSEELNALNLNPRTDSKSGVKLEWSVSSKHNMGGTTIDAQTGKLTLQGWKNNQSGLIMVTATAGKGTLAEVSVSVPVFFHFNNAVNGATIEYTPFAFRVNPSKGGTSLPPSIKGVTDISKFAIDYRRSFNYYDFKGGLTNGQPKQNSGTFMTHVWESYYESVGAASTNYNARGPMSYYDNEKNLNQAYAYVDASSNWTVRVNPGKWKNAYGVYADGAVIGQMTFVTNGKVSGLGSSSNQVFPFFIWFDTNF